MCIRRLHGQGFMAKVITASYPDKNMLKMICHQVNETGSAVTCRAGSSRLICHKSSWIQQLYHCGADLDPVLLQPMDILNTVLNILTRQLTFITETFKLF